MGFGESGQQNAPLGLAVIGGLIASLIATLLFLPSIFGIVQSGVHTGSSSLDPDDHQSIHYQTSEPLKASLGTST